MKFQEILALEVGDVKAVRGHGLNVSCGFFVLSKNDEAEKIGLLWVKDNKYPWIESTTYSRLAAENLEMDEKARDEVEKAMQKVKTALWPWVRMLIKDGQGG